jgi:archaellum biogenesis protein FlaJ (TadC family)
MAKTKGKQKIDAKNLNHIVMMSAWSFTIVVSSFLFLFVGRWIDVKFGTEPAFMLGLFVLAITLCIARMYDDFVKTRDNMKRLRHHARTAE